MDMWEQSAAGTQGVPVVTTEQARATLSVIGRHTPRRAWGDLCRALGLVAEPMDPARLKTKVNYR